MRTALTIRPLDGEPFELAIDGHHFAAVDDGPIDERLDTADWFAIAGLADCHAHLSSESTDHTHERVDGDALEQVVIDHAWAQLQGGVFLVADKGSHSEVSLRILDQPPASRPDLSMAGRIVTAPGGYYGGFGIEVDEADLVAAVSDVTGGGAEWVKLIGDWPRKGVGAIPNYTEEGFAAAVRVAHDAGCRVAIHTCAPETATLAVAAGIDSIEHGLFLTADDVVALGARGGAWVPTIAAMEGIRDMLGAESSGGKLFVDGLNNVRDLIGGAADAGVTVLAGTDLYLAHGGVAGEALKMAEYGMDPAAVFTAMTDAAYEHLGVARGFAPGQAADVLFVDGDPREDLAVLGDPKLIIRHGQIVDA